MAKSIETVLTETTFNLTSVHYKMGLIIFLMVAAVMPLSTEGCKPIDYCRTIGGRKTLDSCADVQLYLECLLWSFCHNLQLSSQQVRSYIQAPDAKRHNGQKVVDDMTKNHCGLDESGGGGRVFYEHVIDELGLPMI